MHLSLTKFESYTYKDMPQVFFPQGFIAHIWTEKKVPVLILMTSLAWARDIEKDKSMCHIV